MHQMQGRVIRSHHRQNPFLSQDKTKTFAGVNSEVFYYLFPNGFLHKIWRQLAFGQLRFVHRHFHCFSVSLSLSDAITIFAHCKECGGHFTLYIVATPQNSLTCQTFRRLNRNVLKQFYIFWINNVNVKYIYMYRVTKTKTTKTKIHNPPHCTSA